MTRWLCFVFIKRAVYGEEQWYSTVRLDSVVAAYDEMFRNTKRTLFVESPVVDAAVTVGDF